MILKLFISFLLTSVTGMTFSLFISGFVSVDVLLFDTLLVMLFYAVPNTVFIGILFWFGLAKEYLAKTWFLFGEILALYVLFYTTSQLVYLLPEGYRYSVTQTATTEKFFVAPEFRLAFSFLLLLIIMILINKMAVNKKS